MLYTILYLAIPLYAKKESAYNQALTSFQNPKHQGVRLALGPVPVAALGPVLVGLVLVVLEGVLVGLVLVVQEGVLVGLVLVVLEGPMMGLVMVVPEGLAVVMGLVLLPLLSPQVVL